MYVIFRAKPTFSLARIEYKHNTAQPRRRPDIEISVKLLNIGWFPENFFSYNNILRGFSTKFSNKKNICLTVNFICRYFLLLFLKIIVY